MRLLDLDPRWLIENDQKVGFVFRSPIKPTCWQSCFFVAGRAKFACGACKGERERHEGHCPHSQYGLFRAAGVVGEDIHNAQACRAECAWTPQGALDFATLTVSPSIDGSAGGLWHGFITNGEIVGGL